MSISIPKSVIQLVAAVSAAVILLLAILSGISAGKSQAQSATVLANASQLAKGLHYFYNDQQRFPSAAEFQDNQNLMLNYFNSFPPATLISANCASSFLYQRPTLDTFKLNFCLPQQSGSFKAGWNLVDEKAGN